MKIVKDKMRYRQGSLGIVIDQDNKFLIVKMTVYGDNEWRFPGGGIKKGESYEEALLRELSEELNSDNFQIIKQSDRINKYDWSANVIMKRFKKKGEWYRGQEQKQFLVRFAGKGSTFDFDKDELKQIKWVTYDELKDHFVFENQWQEAKETIEELLK